MSKLSPASCEYEQLGRNSARSYECSVPFIKSRFQLDRLDWSSCLLPCLVLSHRQGHTHQSRSQLTGTQSRDADKFCSFHLTHAGTVQPNKKLTDISNSPTFCWWSNFDPIQNYQIHCIRGSDPVRVKILFYESSCTSLVQQKLNT
jgi:hypothetical protein